jgi:hypothetical protein
MFKLGENWQSSKSAMLGVQYVPKTQHSLWNTNFLMKKRQELFTIREHIGSPPVFSGVRVTNLR